MKLEPKGKIYTVVRLFIGLIFIVNGSLGLIDPSLTRPDFYSESGLQFFSALEDSGYLMHAVKVIEVLVGAALLTNRFVALALIVLAPVAFNIVAVNLLFWPSLVAAAPTMAILIAPLGYLAFTHRRSYAPLFRAARRPERIPAKSGTHAAPSATERGEVL